MYRGQRPNWLARILNWVSGVVHSAGIAPDYLVSLEVAGRRSGRVVALPLVMVVVNGQRYLASMLGENVHWVRNVRAAGGRAGPLASTSAVEGGVAGSAVAVGGSAAPR